MVYEDRNLAYDLRLFEREEIRAKTTVSKKPTEKRANHQPKPEKKNNVVDMSSTSKPRIKKIKRRKNNFFNIACAVIFAVAVVAVVGLIIHGQVQLTELNQEISSAKRTLEEQQSVYTQLEMKVDASISTAVVEEYAQDKLGMTKVSNSQKEFVSLSEGDKVELTMTDEDTVFEAISQSFSSLWS